MKVRAAAFLLALMASLPALGVEQNRPNQAIKTPVVITSFFSRGSTTFVEGNIRGASTASRLVLFLRLADQRGLRVATNEAGVPQLPQISGNLPPPTFEGREAIQAEWRAGFFLSRAQRVQEIYVVACEVRQRPNATPEGDYRSFQYLPFSEATDIDDALALLRDYGWSPTGFTRIAP